MQSWGIVQVFPSLWCWVWLVLSVESVGLPSVMMWGDHGEVWCCGLSKVWNSGEGCDIHILWLVMLESANYRVLGVNTPRQQVPPRVRYGTACLLIRDVVGSLSCSHEWEINVVTRLGSHSARGAVVLHTILGNLSIALVPRTTLAKPGIRPIVNLCNSMYWSLGHTPKEV
jgi:hypothetical protein